METREIRLSVLKQKIFFRLGTIAVSILLFALFSTCVYNSILQNILIGFTCSLFAWAVVDFIDFSVDTYSVYIDERHRFLHEIIKKLDKVTEQFRFDNTKGNSEENFYQIDCLLSDNNAETNLNLQKIWLDSQIILDELYKYIILFPLKSKIYCCSPEYEKIFHYMTRCHWFLQGCLSNGQVNIKRLYDVLIKKNISSEHYSLNNFLKDIDFQIREINIIYNEMQNIKLSEEPYTPPDELFSKYHYGVISEYSLKNMSNGEFHKGILYFVPSHYIEQLITAKQSKMLFIKNLFVLSIIFPKKCRYFQLYKSD